MKLNQDFPKGNRMVAAFASWAVIVSVAITLAGSEICASPATQQPHADKLIVAGLTKLGLDDHCEIVIADRPDIVENTAAETLKNFLAKGGLEVGIVAESKSTAGPRFLLGRESDFEAIKKFGDERRINIRTVSTGDDGFHLKRIGNDIVVAGANPRGVLYGVYAFEDFVTAGAGGKLDIRKVPRIVSRVQFLPVYMMQDHPAAARDYSEAKIAYLARLTVNRCIDGGGALWDLSRFVSSDVFPFQTGPDADMQGRVARTSALCKKYGIDYHVMIWEPELPKTRADIGQYPPEALGKVKRPWGGDKDGMDTTLCVSSPIVQQHYRNLMTKFVRQYPNVRGILFYNLDGNAWLCSPGLCSRCKAVCTDSPADTPHPWETQAQFTDLLARTARSERSEFKFIHWVSHFHGPAAGKLVHTSREYTALAFGVQNGDHDLMIADMVRPGGSEFEMLQSVCADRAIPFYVTFSSDTHEVIPNGFQFPFAIHDSIQKLSGWGVRNIIGCGPIPHFNQINALAEKEFKWNPDADPEAFVRDLSVRQFGKRAGKLMAQAWREIAKGMDLWKDTAHHPFRGSQTPTSLGFSYSTQAPGILPDRVNEFKSVRALLGNVNAGKNEYDQRREMQRYWHKFELMSAHLAKAAALAKEAVAKADADGPIGLAYYEGDSIPTKKEYAELNHGALAIADNYCRLRCHMIRACLLLDMMKSNTAAGKSAEARALEKQYHDLIRDDVAVRQSFLGLLAGFSQMRPCLTRTSLSEQGIASQLAYMKAEIQKLKAFLEAKKHCP